MYRKIWITLLLSFLNIFPLYCQFMGKLDTIDFNKLSSKDIILLSSKDSLFSRIGKPQRIINNRYVIFFKLQNDSIIKDTILFYNTFDYSNIGIEYVEREGRVRLLSIDFSKCKTIKIEYPKITIDYNLSLDDLSKDFITSFQKKEIYGPMQLPYKTKNKKTYNVMFYSRGKYEGIIQLYFDKNKKIRFVDFGYNDW